MTAKAPTLWTIGHSTREWPVFVAMLQEAGIEAVVDVRRFAGSRRHPQFHGQAMADALPREGIGYLPMPGGLTYCEPAAENLQAPLFPGNP